MPASSACERDAALAAIAGPCSTTQTAALEPLISAIRRTHGPAVAALIYYGSCLRSGDPEAGLVDFYVIVDSYRAAHGSRLSAVCNRLLPPNVYYLEVATNGAVLRCKYALLSRDHLAAGVEHWFQSGIWGRFAQPTAIVYARDDAIRLEMRKRCGTAVITLLERALPALAPRLAPSEGYACALALSYGSELRVESQGRSTELVASDAAEYARRFQAALPWVRAARASWTGDAVELAIAEGARRRARRAWPLRRTQGRMLSILRLTKACFTFTGAIDYAAWKLERHTGVRMEITPRLRRHPLIYGWPLLWRLYRARVLR